MLTELEIQFNFPNTHRYQQQRSISKISHIDESDEEPNLSEEKKLDKSETVIA